MNVKNMLDSHFLNQKWRLLTGCY